MRLSAAVYQLEEEGRDETKEKGAVVVLPLFLFDHSGITMSTNSSGFRACDSAGWDWGQVGFIYATREAVLANFMKKRLTQFLLARAKAVLESEVEIYDQYLRGDVCYEYAKQEAELVMKEASRCCSATPSASQTETRSR